MAWGLGDTRGGDGTLLAGEIGRGGRGRDGRRTERW